MHCSLSRSVNTTRISILKSEERTPVTCDQSCDSKVIEAPEGEARQARVGSSFCYCLLLLLSSYSYVKMPGDETRQKTHDESDSESEDEDAIAETIAPVDIDPSKLTPLSPEVISKQVRP